MNAYMITVIQYNAYFMKNLQSDLTPLQKENKTIDEVHHKQRDNRDSSAHFIQPLQFRNVATLFCLTIYMKILTQNGGVLLFHL